MTKREYDIEETYGRNYLNPTKIEEMMFTGSTETLLNPAYNTKYREWLEKIREPLKIINEVHYSEEFGIEPTIDMVGVGGVGSNQLYMLRDFKDTVLTAEKPVELGVSFFEFDDWEMKNLPRIPFKPTAMKKALTMTNLGLGFQDPEETDFREPLFLEGAHNRETQVIPVGAMDIETRKMLWEARIPFITITHKDNQLKIELCPEPVEELEIMNESYGMIDINFMMPANHLASFWLKDFMCGMNDSTTPAGSVYKLVAEYKKLYETIRMQTITKEEDKDNIMYGDMMYKCKYDSPDELTVAEDIRLWTYTYVFGLLARKEGIEHIYKSVGKEGEAPKFDQYPEEIWNKMKNQVLLIIKQDEVDKFLACKTGEEVDTYCKSLAVTL